MRNLDSTEVEFDILRQICQHTLVALCCYMAMQSKHDIVMS